MNSAHRHPFDQLVQRPLCPNCMEPMNDVPGLAAFRCRPCGIAESRELEADTEAELKKAHRLHKYFFGDA